MTVIQQFRLTNTIIDKRKQKEIRDNAAGGGRSLKCDEVPEMVAVMEFAFGERDRIEFSGGG